MQHFFSKKPQIVFLLQQNNRTINQSRPESQRHYLEPLIFYLIYIYIGINVSLRPAQEVELGTISDCLNPGLPGMHQTLPGLHKLYLYGR